LASLKKGGYIVRIGPAKGGIWEFLKWKVRRKVKNTNVKCWVKAKQVLGEV
jgi:hypothetical protein